MSTASNQISIRKIKRRAKKLKAQLDLPYHQTLNLASQEAGLKDYSHVIRSKQSIAARQYTVRIIETWRDPYSRQSGSVSLSLELPLPLRELVKEHHLQGRLSGMRFAGETHLQGQVSAQSEQIARWYACRAARSLQFMAATGLRPSSKHRYVWPKDDINLAVPGRDHYAVWYHPALRLHFITDEPYASRAVRDYPDREAWCLANGYKMGRAEWRGMHQVDGDRGTVLFLLASGEAAKHVKSLIDKLDRSPPAINQQDWDSLTA